MPALLLTSHYRSGRALQPHVSPYRGGGGSGLEAPSAEQPLGVLLGWEGALRGAQSQHGIPASRRSSCR